MTKLSYKGLVFKPRNIRLRRMSAQEHQRDGERQNESGAAGKSGGQTGRRFFIAGHGKMHVHR